MDKNLGETLQRKVVNSTIGSGDIKWPFPILPRANSVGPDQTPHNAMSDQDLHCLPHNHQFKTHQQFV